MPGTFTFLLRRRHADLALREPDDPGLILAAHHLFEPELLREIPAEGAQG
jgi:hypothetical protein